MKNYNQKGDVLDVVSPTGGALSGDFVLIGALYGVAQITVAAGGDLPIATRGVFSLPKATGAAWAQGDQLYWDATAKNFTKTSSANTLAGVASVAALSGDAFGLVFLR